MVSLKTLVSFSLGDTGFELSDERLEQDYFIPELFLMYGDGDPKSSQSPFFIDDVRRSYFTKLYLRFMREFSGLLAGLF